MSTPNFPLLENKLERSKNSSALRIYEPPRGQSGGMSRTQRTASLGRGTVATSGSTCKSPGRRPAPSEAAAKTARQAPLPNAETHSGCKRTHLAAQSLTPQFCFQLRKSRRSARLEWESGPVCRRHCASGAALDAASHALCFQPLNIHLRSISYL